MSRSGQVMLALTIVAWSIAGTVTYGAAASSSDVRPLWFAGGFALVLAFVVDSRRFRRLVGKVAIFKTANARTSRSDCRGTETRRHLMSDDRPTEEEGIVLLNGWYA